MGAITAAAIAAGATIYSANKQSNAAKGAANAQKNAANAAIQQSEANYQRTAADLNPYIDTGKYALGQINALNSGDYSGFHASPDYQFSLTQGLQGLDRSAAARGSLYSGGHSADVLKYAQGLADQNYNSYYGKLQQLAGMGQNAASNLGSVGAGNAAAIGDYLANAGNAQANGAINGANVNSNMWAQLGNLAGNYLGGQSNQPNNTSSYTGNFNALTGQGTYTGNNSLATTWGGFGNGWGK